MKITPVHVLLVGAAFFLLLMGWRTDRDRASAFAAENAELQERLDSSIDSLTVERERRIQVDSAAARDRRRLEAERDDIARIGRAAQESVRQASERLDSLLENPGIPPAVHDSIVAELATERDGRDLLEGARVREIVVVDSICLVCQTRVLAFESEAEAAERVIEDYQERLAGEIRRRQAVEGSRLGRAATYVGLFAGGFVLSEILNR